MQLLRCISQSSGSVNLLANNSVVSEMAGFIFFNFLPKMSTGRITGPGMALDRLMNFSACINTHCTIINMPQHYGMLHIAIPLPLLTL